MAEKLKFEDLQSPIVAKRKGDDRFHAVGVIGLGVMGQGIAETVAGAGIQVIGIEKNDKALKTSLEGLAKAMDHEIKRWGRPPRKKGLSSHGSAVRQTLLSSGTAISSLKLWTKTLSSNVS